MPRREGGGGAASADQVSVCYAVLALRSIAAHARTNFDALADDLLDEDPRTQARAAKHIGKISESLTRAMPILIAGLGAADPRVQKTASLVLEQIGSYAVVVVPELQKIALDEDPAVARAGIQALVDLGPYAVAGLPVMAKSLEHEDLGVRYYAADGMGSVDDQMRTTAQALQRVSLRSSDEAFAAVRDLAGDLSGSRSELRRSADRSLARIGPEGEARVIEITAAEIDAQGAREIGEISRFTTDAAPRLIEARAKPDYLDDRDAKLLVAVGFDDLLKGLSDERGELQVWSSEALPETSAAMARTSAALDQVVTNDQAVERAVRRARRDIDRQSKAAVAALLAAVKHPDPRVQRAAIQTLGQFGATASPAVADIALVLQSGSDEARADAALALGRIGRAPEETRPEIAVTTLAGALDHPDPAVRYRAVRALGLLGPDAKGAVASLQLAVAKGDPALRYQAARALQIIDPEIDVGDPGALSAAADEEVAALLAAVKGDDRARRREAAVTLGGIGPAAVAAVPDLVVALIDAEPGPRRDIIRSLEAISSEARLLVSALVEVLQAPATEPETRAVAAEILGEMGADANAAQATLVAALTAGGLPIEVRFSLAAALGEIGGYATEVTRSLVQTALRDPDPEVRDNAREGLGQQATGG